MNAQARIQQALKQYTGPNSAYERQRKRVARLEQELAVERKKLTDLERPVLSIAEYLDALGKSAQPKSPSTGQKKNAGGVKLAAAVPPPAAG